MSFTRKLLLTAFSTRAMMTSTTRPSEKCRKNLSCYNIQFMKIYLNILILNRDTLVSVTPIASLPTKNGLNLKNLIAVPSYKRKLRCRWRNARAKTSQVMTFLYRRVVLKIAYSRKTIARVQDWPKTSDIMTIWSHSDWSPSKI